MSKTITVPAGAALRFSTVSTTATLHAGDCSVVANPGRGKGYVVITEEVELEVADLIERGYKVKTCKCLKG